MKDEIAAQEASIAPSWIDSRTIRAYLESVQIGDPRFHGRDASLLRMLADLLDVAFRYNFRTGKHLQIYGEIGELYGAAVLGIALHRNHAKGSDGRLGNVHVEIKTISPMQCGDQVTVDMTGNFGKLLMVRVDPDYRIAHKLIARKAIGKSSSRNKTLRWASF